MKISLALGPRQPLSRQTAWGCFTANAAVPGTGSLAAGHRVGYLQLALTALGLVLTTIFGLAFIYWCLSHWSRIYGADAEPFEGLKESWHVLRWALAGMGLFAISWLWALATSLQILAAAREAEQAAVPPRI